MDKEQMQQAYEGEEYVWGVEPSHFAQDLFVRWKALAPNLVMQGESIGRLTELGCGEGRDSVYFAAQGFEVMAVDVAPAGLAKARKLAQERGVTVHTVEADIHDVDWAIPADIVYSLGALQYVYPLHRAGRFEEWKAMTRKGGMHYMFAFLEHPDVETAPDWGQKEYLYREGELLRYYEDWEVIESYDYIFECNSSGIPHRHAASVVIARKP